MARFGEMDAPSIASLAIKNVLEQAPNLIWFSLTTKTIMTKIIGVDQTGWLPDVLRGVVIKWRAAGARLTFIRANTRAIMAPS